MKDIGYYAGFLSEKDRESITEAEIAPLVLTMSYLAGELADDFYYIPDDVPASDSLLQASETSELSNRDKLAVIRALCDRIEVKLMEVAK